MYVDFVDNKHILLRGGLVMANTEPVFIIDEDAYIPTETYGWCISKRCYENGYLADGLCMKCWDKKAEKRIPKNKKI